MKADKILEELTALAATMNYVVRRETGAFRGGACVVENKRLILLNKSMPLEAASVVLARALSKLDVDSSYVKPAVRELLGREKLWLSQHPEVTFLLAEHNEPLQESELESDVNEQ
jgi:hypothetical protein